jgi:hypothetical protein
MGFKLEAGAVKYALREIRPGLLHHPAVGRFIKLIKRDLLLQ